jgi:4-amino-4-deoxy-L-arabinose transferase-like glycosyltransferase
MTGLMAAVIACFSFNIVMASRWLSNPTPMLLLSMILVWAMMEIIKGRKVGWPVIALVSGLSLFNFGSAAEVFYFPAIAIFLFWQWKNRPSKRYLIWSVILFSLAFLPLVLFDLKHGGILRQNINKFLIGERSFGVPNWRFVWERLEFYFDVFGNKIFHGIYEKEKIILGTVFFLFSYFLSSLWKKDGVKIIVLLLVSPMLGLIFFQGNFGNIYDYYLTGYYLIFILLFAVVLGRLWRSKLGKVFVVFFFYLFLTSNLSVIRYKVTAGSDGPETVVLGNQKRAIDWIYKDAEGKTFNVDVYVPPVIPYAYDYLFKWYGGKFHGYEPKKERIDLLYTLYEVDSPHPERLDAWLERQKGIGEIEKEARFGGITVQRRRRL